MKQSQNIPIVQTQKLIAPIASAPSSLLQRMYSEQMLCDTTIEVRVGKFPDFPKQKSIKSQVGDHNLFAHRAVLAVNSSVFARMFAAGLKEIHEHAIKINDFQFEPVRAMIEFMYAPDKLNEKLDKDAQNSNPESNDTQGW